MTPGHPRLRRWFAFFGPRDGCAAACRGAQDPAARKIPRSQCHHDILRALVSCRPFLLPSCARLRVANRQNPSSHTRCRRFASAMTAHASLCELCPIRYILPARGGCDGCVAVRRLCCHSHAPLRASRDCCTSVQRTGSWLRVQSCQESHGTVEEPTGPCRNVTRDDTRGCVYVYPYLYQCTAVNASISTIRWTACPCIQDSSNT